MTQKFRSGCPLASALDIVGDRWSLILVRAMVMGARSYADFLEQPERIATNILADRLRRLREAGVIRQSAERRGSTRGVYELTPAGADLIPVVQAVARWGEAHLPDRWTPPARFYTASPADFGG